MKEVFLAGVSHHSAPVEVREKLAVPGEDPSCILQQVYKMEGVSGCVVLSTCNRVEYVFHAESGVKERVMDWIAGVLNMSREKVDPMIYVYRGEKAVRHLFRVACALDSMVVGEPQVLGQVKDAFKAAFHQGVTDGTLNDLFQRAFMVAKKVRADTGIGEAAVSVSYAAVEVARKIFGTLEGKTGMLIGAGEMSELAAKHLLEQGVQRMFVVNRTLSRAEELAERFHGNPHPLDALPEILREADVVITSTGSSDPVITREMVRDSIRERRHEPQLIVDIAVPRDVAENAREVDGLYLYDIDDLQHVVDENIKERKRKAEDAEERVVDAVDAFMKRLRQQRIAPAIKELRNAMEVVRRQELEKCMKSIGDLDEHQKAALEKFSSSLLNKFLHQPTARMKRLSGEERAVGMLRKIFGLKEGE